MGTRTIPYMTQRVWMGEMELKGFIAARLYDINEQEKKKRDTMLKKVSEKEKKLSESHDDI
ncbi:MAG: hypothetical protein HXS48_22600 [Theionarchaea archaeon]|nr:hypothetical protein [Theionarchaea archaeon]